VFLSILESSRHELRIAHGLSVMTPSLRGWEAFPTPGALTHTRITWAFSPPAPQVPGVTPGSPLCLWCFWHPLWRGARQDPGEGNHRLLGIRTGHGLRIESGVLSGTRPRIQRQARTRERPTPFQPPPPFRLTTPCRNNSSLRPPGPLQPGIPGFPRAEDTRSSQPENLPPPVRISGRVPFPARRVPRHRGWRRQATRRMRSLLLRT
jgi:hypothetical protein